MVGNAEENGGSIYYKPGKPQVGDYVPKINEPDDTGVTSGELCKECCNNISCKDEGCILYKWRKE